MKLSCTKLYVVSLVYVIFGEPKVFALADTLAAHSIGGFKVGVGFSLRKCRMCLTTISTKVFVQLLNVVLSLYSLVHSKN